MFVRLALLTVAWGCSGDTKPPSDPRPAGDPRPQGDAASSPVAPGPIRFYCSTRPGEDAATCVLAAKGGTDAFARRYEERCGRGVRCDEREGAWCFATPPGTRMDNPFRLDKSACFTDEVSCDARRKAVKTDMLCAPMSTRFAVADLEDSGKDRVERPPIDYHCYNRASLDGDQCFESYWECAYLHHRSLFGAPPCQRVEQVWCYESALPRLGIDRPMETCWNSTRMCESSRAKSLQADRRSRPTPCAIKRVKPGTSP